MSSPIRIDDYRNPRLPLPVRLLNRLPGALARRLFQLDPDALLAGARKRTGLADFGGDGFREPYEKLLAAFENEGRLTPTGRLLTRGLVSQLLDTRLRMQELVARHPEIEDERIEAPIVIIGLPRTGTTRSHNLSWLGRA